MPWVATLFTTLLCALGDRCLAAEPRRHAVSSNQRDGGFTEQWPLCRGSLVGAISDLLGELTRPSNHRGRMS
jgi:hypothetical protein